jgi:hypothetical protein
MECRMKQRSLPHSLDDPLRKRQQRAAAVTQSLLKGTNVLAVDVVLPLSIDYMSDCNNDMIRQSSLTCKPR